MNTDEHTEPTKKDSDQEFEAVVFVVGCAKGRLKSLLDAWDLNTLAFARALRDDMEDSGVEFKVYAKLGSQTPVLLAESKNV